MLRGQRTPCFAPTVLPRTVCPAARDHSGRRLDPNAQQPRRHGVETDAVRNTLRWPPGLAVALCGALLVACGSSSHPPQVNPPTAPHGAAYRLFWAGERFEGLPLVSVSTRYGATS